ncbi:ParB/RepB/Spo0J family partition protein [Methylibium sp.]|uniref:ParB/RepB/Spo0J family partition protein n=1 Tax=Methylibium sp. TaxID=2067992 RepID=UPI002DBDE21D|nr:ParB/RepB/Spo0J family partition protein [Methylibium sp.]
MEHTKELLSINLSDLVPSPFNVRRHSPGQVEELAALIESQGLLHPLMVTEQVVGRGKTRGIKFAVAAGERRRRALLLLQQHGRLPKTHEVLCELLPPERALEVSIAENSGREALHPADEFDAFKAMIDEGKGVEDVAARFGVSVLTVQRRLKLSALSPKLLTLYREDGINLDQLMALALSDEHSAQERTWFDAPSWDRSAAALKRKLTAGEIEAASDALARYVGLEAYEAAGGVVRRDLFDDEQSRFLSDPTLLQRLATEKLEALAVPVRAEGWAWVEVRLEADARALRQFSPCEASMRKPTPRERADLDELAARASELERLSDAMAEATYWTADEAERIDLEEQAIVARRRAIHEALKVWSPETMAHAGAVVTINREGEAEVIRGLMQDADRKAMAAAQKAADRSARRVGKPSDGSSSHPDATNRVEPPAAFCSESLGKRLAAHRTVALQAELVRSTPIALAVLAHAFVQRAFGDDYRRVASALQIAPQTSAHALQAAADDLKVGSAWQAIEAAKLAWKERLPERSEEWLHWLIALPQTELLDLLGLCASLTLNALPNCGAVSGANAIAGAVGLDMADWWEPTAQGYLNHVPKAQIVQALQEAGPDLADDGVGAMKKDVLVVKAAARLAGKRWLPAQLRRLPN